MVIVLSICKIFGILLLVLACILLLILLVPVSYELDLDIDERTYKFRVSWMFSMVRFRFQFRERMEAVLSILFFKIDFTNPEEKEKREKKKERKTAKKAAKTRKAYEKQAAKRERKAAKKRKAYLRKRNKHRTQQDVRQEASTGSAFSETESGKTKNPESQKAAAKPEEKDSIKEKLVTKSQTVKKAVGTVQRIKEFLHQVSEHQIIYIILPKLQLFLMRIRPRALRGCIEFGLEDPALTGQILGGIAMIPVLYQTELQIIPDFETEDSYIKGKVYTRGHMFPVHLLLFVLQLVKEKNIRRFIRVIRKKN